MKNSLLQLKRYFFPAILVSAHPNFLPGKYRIDKDFQTIFYPIESLIVKKNLSRNKDNPFLFQVNLEIESGLDVEAPYHFALQCIGEFEISKDVSEEKIGALIAVNGASVLYSACRELLIDQTAKSAHGTLTLPTVVFDPVSPEMFHPEGLKAISDELIEDPEGEIKGKTTESRIKKPSPKNKSPQKRKV